MTDKKKSVKKPKVEKFRYRVENGSGELIGYVMAENEGDASRKAVHKYGVFAGQHVRMAGG